MIPGQKTGQAQRQDSQKQVRQVPGRKVVGGQSVVDHKVQRQRQQQQQQQHQPQPPQQLQSKGRSATEAALTQANRLIAPFPEFFKAIDEEVKELFKEFTTFKPLTLPAARGNDNDRRRYNGGRAYEAAYGDGDTTFDDDDNVSVSATVGFEDTKRMLRDLDEMDVDGWAAQEEGKIKKEVERASWRPKRPSSSLPTPGFIGMNGDTEIMSKRLYEITQNLTKLYSTRNAPLQGQVFVGRHRASQTIHIFIRTQEITRKKPQNRLTKGIIRTLNKHNVEFIPDGLVSRPSLDDVHNALILVKDPSGLFLFVSVEAESSRNEEIFDFSVEGIHVGLSAMQHLLHEGDNPYFRGPANLQEASVTILKLLHSRGLMLPNGRFHFLLLLNAFTSIYRKVFSSKLDFSDEFSLSKWIRDIPTSVILFDFLHYFGRLHDHSKFTMMVEKQMEDGEEKLQAYLPRHEPDNLDLVAEEVDGMSIRLKVDEKGDIVGDGRLIRKTEVNDCLHIIYNGRLVQFSDWEEVRKAFTDAHDMLITRASDFISTGVGKPLLEGTIIAYPLL